MTTSTQHNPITCCGHEGEHEWQGPIFGCEYHGCGGVKPNELLQALKALQAEVHALLNTDESDSLSDWNWGPLAELEMQARHAIAKAEA